MQFLWLCCEGWVRFGPYENLRFDEKHNILADKDNKIAIFSGFNFRLPPTWKTLEKYEKFRWEKPVFTSSEKGPYADRVYIIHFPLVFKNQVEIIKTTCERSHLIVDDGTSHARKKIMKLVFNELENINPFVRLSVYTRDLFLAQQIGNIDLSMIMPKKYFGIHWINTRGPKPWENSVFVR